MLPPLVSNLIPLQGLVLQYLSWQAPAGRLNDGEGAHLAFPPTELVINGPVLCQTRMLGKCEDVIVAADS